MGEENFAHIDQCAVDARKSMPTEEETETAIDNVDEPFNMWEFVRGYANDKVLVFECMGWLGDDGATDIPKLSKFMSSTLLSSYFSGMHS